MATNIAVLGIWLAGMAAQALLAGSPPDSPAARAASNRIVVQSHGSSYLGVAVVDITPDRAKELHLKEEIGVEVTYIDAGSPAAKAGLKAGDVVLEYNGERVEGGEQFIRLVRETPPGRSAKLSVWRDGGTQTLTATIGQRQPSIVALSTEPPSGLSVPPVPEMPMPPSVLILPDMPRPLMSWRSPVLGIESEALNPQLAEFFGVKEGVLVRSVSANSIGEKAGFKAGDVIIKVDGQKVVSPKEISSILQESRAKKTLPITVIRHQKELILNITLEENSSWPALGTREML